MTRNHCANTAPSSWQEILHWWHVIRHPSPLWFNPFTLCYSSLSEYYFDTMITSYVTPETVALTLWPIYFNKISAAEVDDDLGNQSTNLRDLLTDLILNSKTRERRWNWYRNRIDSGQWQVDLTTFGTETRQRKVEFCFVFLSSVVYIAWQLWILRIAIKICHFYPVSRIL